MEFSIGGERPQRTWRLIRAAWHRYVALPRLDALIKGLGVDLIHCHCKLLLNEQLRVANRLKIPFVWTSHGPPRLPSRRTRQFVSRVQGSAVRVRLVECGPGVGTEVVGKAGAGLEFQTIVNGVERHPDDTIHRTEVRASLGVDPDSILIVAAGRLVPQKGFDFLAEAVHLLAAEETPVPWQVRILGDGYLEEALRAQIRRLGIEDRVALAGYRSDVSTVLASADIVVQPSRFEGLPLALLEAMASGLPAVVADVGSMASVVREARCGLVVRLEDPVELYGALLRLLRDPEERAVMADKARMASALFSNESMCLAYDELYTELRRRT